MTAEGGGPTAAAAEPTAAAAEPTAAAVEPTAAVDSIADSIAAAADILHVLVGLIEDADGRVLINQRRPGTHMAGHWEFPGGKRDDGESRFDALRRELAEELGIDVFEAAPWMELVHAYPERTVRLDIWRVTRYGGMPQGREGQALQWVEPERLLAAGLMPADRPIVDKLLRRG